MAERIVEEAEFLEQPASTWTQEYLKGIGLGFLGILILTALVFGLRFLFGRRERERGRHERA